MLALSTTRSRRQVVASGVATAIGHVDAVVALATVLLNDGDREDWSR